MKDTLRVGLVGAGFAATFHLESLVRVYGTKVEVPAVTSRRKESREAFAAKHGMTAYDSIEAMLDHVDVLDIVSPPYAHEEGILAAAGAGKGVICEKPLTGYFGPADADEAYRGDRAPKKEMLAQTIQRLQRIAAVVQA